MRHHCLLIGFHSWPTFCPWGFSSLLCISSHVSNCEVKEGGGTVHLWVCRLDSCAISNYPPLWERQGVTDMLTSPCHFFPISKRLPTPLFYISFDLQTGGAVRLHFCTPLYVYSNEWTFLFTIWESREKIYLSLSGWYVSSQMVRGHLLLNLVS